jgi:tripartite-type tricarboxylate transporter receptor subunit TctC
LIEQREEKTMRGFRTLFAAAVAAALSLTAAGQAGAAGYPAGTTITLAIPSGTGGGYDLYSRLVARHLGNHLTGKPNIVPKNMPGAGGVIAANWIYNVAPKDGTAIAMIQSASPFEPLLGNAQAEFDPRKFTWLISLNKLVNIVAVWHTAPVKTPDLFTREVMVGGTGAGSNPVVFPRLMNSLAGTKFKIIPGYEDNNQVLLAMERGEVDGAAGMGYDAVKSTRADVLRDKKMQIVMQIALARHPELPDVPLIMDYVKGDENRQIMELVLARQENGRPFVAPPGLSPEMTAELQSGFAKMVKDPAFLAEAAKLNLEINLSTPQEILALIDKVVTLPKPLVDKAIKEIESAGK